MKDCFKNRLDYKHCFSADQCGLWVLILLFYELFDHPLKWICYIMLTLSILQNIFFQQLDIISPLQIYLDPTAVFSKYQVNVKLKKFN